MDEHSTMPEGCVEWTITSFKNSECLGINDTFLLLDEREDR